MTIDSTRTAGDRPIRPYITTTVARVSPDATLAEVAEKLNAAEIGALVVASGTQTVDGIISERDLIHAIANGRNLTTTRASEVASTQFLSATPTDSIGSLAATMLESDVRHIVIRARGELIGIVSIRDLLRALVQGIA